MKGLVRAGIAAAVAIGLSSVGAAPALATTVNCGDVITQDTKLDNDLTDCPGDGIVIGADKITLDLNGHMLAGRACPDPSYPPTCAPQDGIDNSAGHDRVVIENGTITSFENGVVISDGDRNQLVGLEIVHDRAYGAPGTGISMLRSERNRVLGTEAWGGAPAILLSDSDRNTIEESRASGFIEEHYGDGIQLLDGSDDNRLIGNKVDAEWSGIFIDSSRRNLLKGNAAGGYAGNVVRGGERNVIVDNALEGGTGNGIALRESNDNRVRRNTLSIQYLNDDGMAVSGDRNIIEFNHVGLTDGVGMDVFGSDNLVRNNSVKGGYYGIRVSGDRNVLESNSVGPIAERGITVYGSGNLIRKNTATGAYYFDIEVKVGSSATVVEANLATRSRNDGILVDAPGTLIRRNVANDNGDLGIEAVEGVIDGGGNRASGNGNPLQCLNVVCK